MTIQEQLESWLRLKEQEVAIDDDRIRCQVCHNEEELYHLTRRESAVEIIKEGVMRPSGHSKSVSFSANPNHTYGGNVKIIFDQGKLIDQLRPMCYFSGFPEAFGKKEHALASEGRSLDDARTEMGLQPDIYKDECEWYSQETMRIPEKAIRRIEYFITWPISPHNVDCERHIPHTVDMTLDSDYKHMLEDVAQLRGTAKGLGIPFEVTSCFPYIRRGWQYIMLNDENLKRFTKGEEPIITFERPEQEECVERIGCRKTKFVEAI